MTSLLGEKTRNDIWAGTVIDCDVHANVPSIETLFDYQDELWVQWTQERGYRGPVAAEIVYPPGAPTTARPEWRPEGRPPASDLSMLREHILDPWNVERAVLNCYYGVDSLRHPDWAASLASAVNDWIIDQWLDKDPRLVASITIPARDPAAAVAEIERVGDHPGFVQVLVPARSERLYGQRIFHPIYEAMTRHDLVMGLHWGGTTEDIPSTSGFASWWVEEFSGEWGIFLAQVTSLIAEGVFKAFPALRVSVLESGFTWVPIWGWRMNQKWKGLRREVPWLDRPPFDVLREHFRFSTSPTQAGPPEELQRIIHWLHSEDLLMFATDYPHGHEDDTSVLLDAMPPSMRLNVMSETARRWYRL